MAPSPIVLGSLVVTLGIGIATITYQYWLRPTLDNCVFLHDYFYSSRSSPKKSQEESDDHHDQSPENKNNNNTRNDNSHTSSSLITTTSSQHIDHNSNNDSVSDSPHPCTRRISIENELMNTDFQLDQLRSRRELLEQQLSQLLVHNVENEVISHAELECNDMTVSPFVFKPDNGKPISELDSFDPHDNEINQLYPTVNQDILNNPSIILPIASSPIPSINPNSVTIPILSTNYTTSCDTDTDTESVSQNSDSLSNHTHVDDDQQSDSEFSLISAGSADGNIH